MAERIEARVGQGRRVDPVDRAEAAASAVEGDAVEVAVGAEQQPPARLRVAPLLGVGPRVNHLELAGGVDTPNLAGLAVVVAVQRRAVEPSVFAVHDAALVRVVALSSSGDEVVLVVAEEGMENLLVRAAHGRGPDRAAVGAAAAAPADPIDA